LSSSGNETYSFYGATVTVSNLVALVQSNSVQGSGVTSVSAAFASSNTAGNLIVAFVRMSTATQTVVITDTAGNMYTNAVSQAQTTDGHQVYIFYAPSILKGSNTVTATFSSTNNHPWLAIYEYSGLSRVNPLDQTAHAQGSNSAVSTGQSGTTTSANELVFVGAGFVNNFSGSVSPGSNDTLQQQNTGTSRAANETGLVTSKGSLTGTFSLNPDFRYLSELSV
jgi:hypothetical protein